MKILALDTGGTTGWAVGMNPAWVESGTEKFAVKKGTHRGYKFYAFWQWLDSLVDRTRPTQIIYEEPLIKGKLGRKSIESCVGFTTLVESVAAKYKIPYEAIHPSTLKKASTGYGKASKDDMIAKATEIFEFEPADDNEADALMLLHYGLHVTN